MLWVVLAVLLGASTAVGLVACGGGAGEPEAAEAPAAEAADCDGLPPAEARACYIDAFSAQLEAEDDPRPVVQEITDGAREQGGFLLPNCHGIMHTVARRYAASRDVTLASLMDFLPQTNDPGCPAGFAHGLVTAVAPEIDQSNPGAAAQVCEDAGTRYQRYSCTHGFGHAFMRMHGDELEPALAMCDALGERSAPDCAQGAFHDYWFAVVGVDEAKLPGEAVTDPRALCAEQEEHFVRACWYRAFVDSRPEGFEVAGPADFERACSGLEGVQREGCITATSVLGPPDPAQQLVICAELKGADVGSCIRGAKVQNLIGAPISDFVGTIRVCDVFGGRDRATCYRWLGKTSSVVTDGAFATEGCGQLDAGLPRRACAAGAAEIDEALVTFS